MTEIESAAPESATTTERPAPMVRLVGVDLARALEVPGMSALRVGPAPTPGGGAGDWFLEPASAEPAYSVS